MPGMESGFELPICIQYRPSRWINILLLISHLGAVLCLFLSNIIVWVKLVLITVIVYSYARHSYSPLGLKGVNYSSQLMLNSEDEWKLISSEGAIKPLHLKSGSYVHPKLIVLRLSADENKDYTFILTQDNTDSTTLRRLRVRLRYKKQQKNVNLAS